MNRDKIKNKVIADKLKGCLIRVKDTGRQNKKFVESKIDEICKILKEKIPLKKVI